MPSQFETAKPPAVPPARRDRQALAWVLGGVAGALVVLTVVAALALQTADLSRLAAPIAAAVRRATGRELVIGRGPTIRMSLPLSVTADDVTLSNAPWGTRREMLRVRRIELRVGLLPLLFGRVAVHRLRLVEPDLFLETNPAGKGNWVLEAVSPPASAGPARPGASPTSRVALGELRVERAAIAYRDGCGGWIVGVAVPHLDAAPRWTSRGRLAVDGEITFGRARIAVSGALGEASTGGSAPFPVSLSFRAPGAAATVDGSVARISDMSGVDLKVGVEVSDAAALGAALRIALPNLSPCRLGVRVRDAGPAWLLDSLEIAAGKSTVAGSASYRFGCPRSRLDLDLRSGSLDLAELSASAGTAAPPRAARPVPGRAVFSREPLPLAVLGAVDSTVDVRLQSLRLPSGAQARSLEARASLNGGALDVEKFSVELGGGRISGSLRARSGAQAGFDAKLEGKGIALAALLAAAGATAAVEGAPTDLSISLSGSGPSLHAWMASLDGRVRAVAGRGSFESRTLALGGDVLSQGLAAVLPGRGDASRVELRCAVFNVPISDGVADLDRRVAAETSRFNIAVAGSVNLGTEMVDLDIRSRATEGLGLGLANLATLARVRGPLSGPTLALDPKDALETAYSLRSLFKTRGRSLVQDTIRGRAFPDSPCATARRASEPRRRSLLDLFRHP